MTAVIQTSSDDVEERRFSYTSTSQDLDINERVLIGLRYQLCIPLGATITEATITFVAEETDSVFTTAQIYAERTGNAASFLAFPTVSGRIPTTTSHFWQVPAFIQNNSYETPDLSGALIEAINSTATTNCQRTVVFIVAGDGDRGAWSYDWSPALAPVLNVTYTQ